MFTCAFLYHSAVFISVNHLLSPSIVIPASSDGVFPSSDICGLMCKAVNCVSLIIYLYTFFTSLLMSNHKKSLCVEGEALDLLKQLLQDGYVYTGKNRNKLRFLQRIFPVIKRSQFKNKSIYYLEDKNKLALQEMMIQNKSRIISFQDLSRMSQVFNTDLEIKQKRTFLGKNLKPKRYKIKKFRKCPQSFTKEKQAKIDDFLGRFLHSELLDRLCVKVLWEFNCGKFTVFLVILF